jgi:threonine aldolase
MKLPAESGRHFASDNYSGACPEVMAALQAANQDHTPSYGNDPWTTCATDLIRALFETDCDVFFVFNGTAANALSLASLCQSYHRVICYAHNHLASDECGAPGFFAHGITLHLLPSPDGKLTARMVEAAAKARTDVHHNKAGALSITQATELGTVYSLDELSALGSMTRRLGLGFHMDGARLANAIASLGCRPRTVTWEAGVDVLSLGGTKNGMIAAEAVVFFNRDLARDFEYRRKQAGQLSSKMRFIAAQWIGALETSAWLRNAQHANAMAARLEQGLSRINGVRVVYGRQANAVFASLPEKVCDQLRERGWMFYNDVGPDRAARLMCSWDTAEADVDGFVRDVADVMR